MEQNNNDDSNIKLGGFPPIYYISNETLKKREFRKKIENEIDTKNMSKLNILNIKNILQDIKKK